jgi:hypothetical protein
MKKPILIIIIIICTNINGAEMFLGIKSGLSVHKFELKYNLLGSNINSHYRIGPTLNTIFEINIFKYLQQQINFGYFQAGGTEDVFEASDSIEPNITTGKWTLKFDYLNIGYCLNFIWPKYLLKPYLSAGLQLDYLINYDDLFKVNNKVFIMHTFKYSELNKINITPLLGLGIQSNVKNVDIFMEILSSYEFLPFYKNSKVAHYTYGYIFNFGIKTKI